MTKLLLDKQGAKSLTSSPIFDLVHSQFSQFWYLSLLDPPPLPPFFLDVGLNFMDDVFGSAKDDFFPVRLFLDL